MQGDSPRVAAWPGGLNCRAWRDSLIASQAVTEMPAAAAVLVVPYDPGWQRWADAELDRADRRPRRSGLHAATHRQHRDPRHGRQETSSTCSYRSGICPRPRPRSMPRWRSSAMPAVPYEHDHVPAGDPGDPGLWRSGCGPPRPPAGRCQPARPHGWDRRTSGWRCCSATSCARIRLAVAAYGRFKLDARRAASATWTPTPTSRTRSWTSWSRPPPSGPPTPAGSRTGPP